MNNAEFDMFNCRVKDESDAANDEDLDKMPEPSEAEDAFISPADPSTAEAQLIASRLCLCTHKTQLYVAAAKDGKYHSFKDQPVVI